MKKTTLILLAATISLTGCFDYSNGTRSGTVTKFSHKGIFCKTWEGELNVGGFRNRNNGQGGSTVVANIFEFTVEDEKIVPQIQAALESDKPVVLEYHEELFTSPCRSSTNYFITGVKDAAQ